MGASFTSSGELLFEFDFLDGRLSGVDVRGTWLADIFCFLLHEAKRVDSGELLFLSLFWDLCDGDEFVVHVSLAGKSGLVECEYLVTCIPFDEVDHPGEQDGCTLRVLDDIIRV